MKRQRPRKWTDEKERKLLEFAGKISDADVAAMVGANVKWIRRIRSEHNIPKHTNRKYTDEQMDYVLLNYKFKSITEIVSELRKLYPETRFSVHGIKDRLWRNGFIRTTDEANAIRSREAQLPGAAERFKRIAETCRKHQRGDVFWSSYYKEWIIVMDNYNLKFYKVYVWEQHNPKLQRSHYVKIIDPNKPITIDNLEMVKKSGSFAAINLTDNWVISTMMHNKDESHREWLLQNPIEIDNQRLKIEVIREIKAIENENRKLAQAPEANAQRLL
jgi:uncharacterized protein YlbG (UPF0298 family)